MFADIKNIDNMYEEYNRYMHSLPINKYLADVDKVLISNKKYQLLYYKASKHINSNINFFIIPSLFNSPEILFINKTASFVENLKKLGNVYLLDWAEQNYSNSTFDDYVLDATEVISSLSIPVELIGHCIGGTLAIAISSLDPSLIKSLSLLTTPWDFSHFFVKTILYQKLNIDYCVKDLSYIPKIYIQILFFLQQEESFHNKIEKFCSIQSERDKELFFTLERWLLSSKSLPKTTFLQIINEFIIENKLSKRNWKIKGKNIDPTLIDVPVYQVIAHADKLVPYSSVYILHESLPNSTMFLVEGGHVSYLIGNQLAPLFDNYKIWLENKNEKINIHNSC